MKQMMTLLAGIVVWGGILSPSHAQQYQLELTTLGDGLYITGQLIGGKTANPMFNVNVVASIRPIPLYYNWQTPVFCYTAISEGQDESKTIPMHWKQNLDGAALYEANGPWEVTRRRGAYRCYVTWGGFSSGEVTVYIAKGRQAELIAEEWLGSPYHFGGKGPAYCPGNPTHGAPNYCFDCSGLVWWCYEKVNAFPAGGPTPSFNRNAQWFHDNRRFTPSDPVKGEYITFGSDCWHINHIAMQRQIGSGTGTIEATPPSVQYGSYNPNSPRTDHYGSLFYLEERPPGD
jgi:hypothetical protein